MLPITLDQLEVFRNVAASGSFSAAARSLGRAQSAISYAIANLERLLDVELFDRSSRRPALTEAGRLLLEDAEQVLADTARLNARARMLSQSQQVAVSLAIDVMYPLAPILETLGAFRDGFPDVSLSLHSEALGAVAKLVLDGVCQVGIGPAYASYPRELVRRALPVVVEMVCVCAPEHPLAKLKPPIPAAATARYPQLVLTDRSSLTRGQDWGVLGGRSWRLADLSTKHALLRAGFGWGNMPLHMVEAELASGALIELRPAASPERQPVPQFALYRAADPPGAASRWLLDRLAAC